MIGIGEVIYWVVVLGSVVCLLIEYGIDWDNNDGR